MTHPVATGRDRHVGARSLARLLGEWRPPGGRGLAGALTDRVRLLVLDGRVPVGVRVPAERELAAALGVSRTTVAAAYLGLREAGVLRSRRGSGNFTRLPDGVDAVPPGPIPFAPGGGGTIIDFANAALPAAAGAVRAAAAAAVTDLDAHLGGHGYDLHGLPVLRAAIARRYTDRGLPTTPDQVLVTTGAQHAIALVLTALVAPGDRVLVEHPTYPNALTAITSAGARPVPVPMAPGEPASWDLDLVAAAVHDAAPRLAYLIPDFQNPTGAVLDPAGRERLVEVARRTGTVLLVDETLSELGIEEHPPPPLAAHGGADSPSVLTVGSASKIFWGGLRIGWLRGQASTIRRLAALRPALDLGSPLVDQLVTARLLDDTDAIARGRRVELAQSRDHLRERLATTFPGWVPSRPAGGLFLWVDLGEPASSRLTSAARRHDLLLAAGPRFGLDGAFERRLRLPFTLRREHADDAVDRLARAWRDLPGTAAPADPADPASAVA